jgi:hypothetical protein
MYRLRRRPDNVEGDSEAVADAYHAVEGGGRLDAEVAAVDVEVSAGAQVAAGDGDLGRDADAARDAVEREVARNPEPVDAAREPPRDGRTLKDDLRVLVGFEDEFAQLAVDDLLLLLGENVARLGERGGADDEPERGRLG